MFEVSSWTPAPESLVATGTRVLVVRQVKYYIWANDLVMRENIGPVFWHTDTELLTQVNPQEKIVNWPRLDRHSQWVLF